MSSTHFLKVSTLLMISANHLSDSLGCLQIAALNSCNQLFYIAVILTKYGRIQYMFPVDIPIVQLCLHTILKRGHPQISSIAKFLNQCFTNGELRFN